MRELYLLVFASLFAPCLGLNPSGLEFESIPYILAPGDNFEIKYRPLDDAATTLTLVQGTPGDLVIVQILTTSATRGTANLNLPLHIVPGNDYFFEVRRLELTTYSARLTITADKQQNKTTTSQSSSSSPTSNSNSNTSPPKPLNPLPTSTKISIAIGTITGILILALTIFIFLSRRRKAATKRVLKNDGNDEFGFTKKSEMDGQGIAKNTQMVELAGKEFKVVEISGVEVWGELGVEPVEMEARERPRELGVEVGKEVLTLGKGCG